MWNRLKSFLLENTTVSQTITKNTFWLFFGQLMSRLLRAAIVIYAARVLGAGSWGAFAYALGVATFLTIFSDIGINALVTKEASRSAELKDQYLATAFFIKLGLLVILVLGVIIFFPYLTRIPEAALVMPILMFVFVFDTLRDLGSALSRALERMQIEAGIQIFTNFAIVTAGFIFLSFHRTGESLAYAYALGSGLGLATMFYALRHHFFAKGESASGGKNIFQNFRKDLIKPIIVTAWPFGLLGLMGVIMLNTDIIMLGWLRSPAEVGYYSAAQKLIQVLYVLPALFAASVFPIMSRLVKTDTEAVKKLLEKSVALVILISLPTAILGILFGGHIIQLLFGAEYLPAILTFRILIATILIVYPAPLLGYAIFAYGAQKNFIWFVAVAALGNVLFNFLLIPKFGIEGAAVSTILVQLLTNALIWNKVKKITHLAIWPQVKYYLSANRNSPRL